MRSGRLSSVGVGGSVQDGSGGGSPAGGEASGTNCAGYGDAGVIGWVGVGGVAGRSLIGEVGAVASDAGAEVGADDDGGSGVEEPQDIGQSRRSICSSY